MKLLILSFALSLATTCSLLAQGGIPKPTHYNVKFAQSPSLPLEDVGEGFTYFDNNGHAYQTKYNKWAGGNWVLEYREYYTLNAQGQPTEILRRSWNEAAEILVDNTRTTIGYHSNGLENYLKVEFWNTTTSLWQTRDVFTITFGPNDKTQEITDEFYIDGVLKNGTRNIYNYDGTDRVSEAIRQSWSNNEWTNHTKTEYVYNGPDEDYDESFLRNWDNINNVWSGVSLRETQTVTSAQRIVLSDSWDGFTWNLYGRNTTNYNANDQEIEFVSEAWDGNTSAWLVYYKYEYAYNNDLSSNQYKYFFKDFFTQVVYLYAQVDYDYGLYAVSTQAPALQAKVSISPNPTADVVRVELEGKAISNLTLLDLYGNVIARTTTASHTAQLSLQGQPAGTYFLRVEQGGEVKVLPVIKN